MSDELDKELNELEEAIYKTEESIKDIPEVETEKSGGARCYSYTRIIGIIIPILTLLALWFVKPKWVTEKEKGKYVFSARKFVIWLVLITAIGWGALYIVNYCGALDGMQLCLGA